MKFEIKDNAIYFVRKGEWGRISACEKNTIRFQASPNGPVIEQNWTIEPKRMSGVKAWTEEGCAYLQNGEMQVKLLEDGRTFYTFRGKQIL